MNLDQRRTMENESGKKKANGWKPLIMFLVCLGFGMGVGFLAGVVLKGSKQDEDIALPLAYKLSAIVWLPLSFLLPLAVHELGHVWAGLLQKFDFRSYTVAFFHFYKEGGRLKFKFLTKSFKGFLGLAICLPQESRDTKKLLRQFTIYVLGGPVASLLLAVVGVLLYAYWGRTVPKSEPFAYVFALFVVLTGFFSLIIFIMTIIPVKAKGGFSTDGARVFTLLKGGDEAVLDITLLSTIAASTSGVPPEQLNKSMLEEATQLPVQSMYKAYCHLFLYNMELQKRNIPKAAIHLEEYAAGVDLIPEIVQGSVWLERAFFEARYKEDVLQAKQYYRQVKPSAFITKDLFLRAEAAIALADGKEEEAILKAKEAQEVLKTDQDKGSAAAYTCWLSEMIQQAEIRTAAKQENMV